MTSSNPGGFSNVVWRKSRRSTAGNQCVEISHADTSGRPHLIRDSKNPDRGSVTIGPAAWKTFLAAVKRGDFDL